MSKEKQIEETTETLCDIQNKGMKCNVCDMECDCRMLAEAIYNAGYRKQSEGKWIDKPTGAYGRTQSWCSACGKHSGIGGIESN